VSDQPNRDHRCRTCEHWGAPLGARAGVFVCTCPLPSWASPRLMISEARMGELEGGSCHAYTYSYRRARLVKP